MIAMLLSSRLGRRYKPHIEEIRIVLATLATLFRPASPLLMLAWVRLHNSLARLDRLATRWHHDRLRPPAPRLDAPRRRTASAVAEPRPRAPGAHAWLIRLHQPMAQFAPRIDMLVNDPDTLALCAATPQAGRILRPLCRMFGLAPPPHIARPPAPRKPRPKKPKPPPLAEHSPLAEHLPAQWPFVPLRLRLRVPGLPKRKPPD